MTIKNKKSIISYASRYFKLVFIHLYINKSNINEGIFTQNSRDILSRVWQ